VIGGVYVNYKELLELTQKHPDCFWDKEQKSQESEYRYKMWAERAKYPCAEENSVEKND